MMADVVSLRTLLIKIPGLMLSVAAGSRFRDLGNHFLELNAKGHCRHSILVKVRILSSSVLDLCAEVCRWAKKDP